MARYLFNLPPVQPTQTVRLDTASGSDSPAADVTMPDGTAVSATLTSGHDGLLPEVYSASATLYLKRLTYGGTVTGSPQTLTGSNQSPSAPTSGGGVSAVVAGSGISVDATDPANPIVAATGGGLTTGTTIGVDTLTDPNTVRVAFVSPWGIDGDGNPYYVDGGFAVAGEAAILCVNPTTGNFAVVRPDGAVAV